jgi:diguanylate cyclase (GGDEF)-like protein
VRLVSGLDTTVPASRRDVLLGAALVVAFSVLVATTSSLLDASDGAGVPALLVASAGAIIGIGLACLPWRSMSPTLLLVFPLTLIVAEAALAIATNGVAANYTGFLTLAFLYVGLTQDRAVVPAIAVLAAASWLLCQENLAASTWLRLGIALVIWTSVGWLLATRAERDRVRSSELVARANNDVLTGLASRLHLSDQIDRAIDEIDRSKASLLVLDLDGFKSVNDTFGHATGDEVLIAIADRIRATTRPTDVAARLGGDEFAVLLRDADLRPATRVAERFLETLTEPITLSRGRVAITASIGIVEVVPSANAQELLRDADLAMYEAKAAGRNRLSVYRRDMQERRAARLQLETELQEGLKRKEFELYYQPVVNLRTGAIVGTEALLRWNHPERGLLTPDQFLATSEEIGVIVALGGWILREACSQAARWQPADPARALTMSVNLSGPELIAADSVSRIRDILAATGLAGALLVLEITERLLVTDAPVVRKRINELKQLGVRIAIDDFGTGYSSLAYLREFPVDIIKIDQSFVKPLGIDMQATALMKSIVAIADALNLDIIVEGVETRTHVEILTGLGCEVAQGFYFSRPGPADLIAEQLGADAMRPSPLPQRS